jgi:predicted RNase H-like HicB family nuclease
MQYLVTIAGDDTKEYGAYVPDLPGCSAAAAIRED